MQQILKSEDEFNFNTPLESVNFNLGKKTQLPYEAESTDKEFNTLSCIQNVKSYSRTFSGLNTYSQASPRCTRSVMDFDIVNLEWNKEKIKNARKQLHKKLTSTNPSEEQLFDNHIGDSYDVTPITSSSNMLNINPVSVYTPEVREMYIPKRKSSIKIPEIKYSKTNRKGNKVVSKFVTQPSYKILPENVFDRKFKCFVEKSIQSISEIRNLLDKGIEPPDGDADIFKRKLRVREFSNRFSRNYLYPIVRQIDELSKFKQTYPSTNQKMLNAYHVIYNGLIAYQNHLPTSIGACSSDKLKLLLKHLMDLCDIHFNLILKQDENGYCDFLQSFKQNTQVTLQKVEDRFSKYNDLVTPSQPNTPKLCSEEKTNRMAKKNKNNLENRLYMYSTSTKAFEVLGKKRLGIKSRYKTSQFKHRPLLEKARIVDVAPTINSMTNNCKHLTKKSNTNIKKSTFAAPMNEDNISTMIQMVNVDVKDDLDAEKKDECETEVVDHDKIVVKLLQLALEIKDRNKINYDTNIEGSNGDKITQVLEKINDSCDYETLKKILNELYENKMRHCDAELELKIQNSDDSICTKSPIIRNHFGKTTDDFEKAKTVCKKNSIYICSSNEDKEKVDQTVEILHSGNISDLCKENKERAQIRDISTNMKRSSKSPKYFKMLPKDFALSIIQYKIDFYKHCKTNPMYSTTKGRPWIIMNKLSDEILNRILLGVAKEVEIEISGVADKIYQSELRF